MVNVIIGKPNSVENSPEPSNANISKIFISRDLLKNMMFKQIRQ